MAIQVLQASTALHWAGTQTVSIVQKVKKGDIVVVLIMSTNLQGFPANGFSVAGTTALGMRLYYKEITSDGTLVSSAYVATGALHSFVLRSTYGKINIVKTGDANSSDREYHLGASGTSSYVVTVTGNSNGTAYFTDKGWKRVLNSGWGDSDYYTSAIKEFKNENMIIPAHPYWGNSIEPYMVLKEASTVEVYVSTSNDGVSFSEYEKFDSSKIPSARYLKFKANIQSLEAKTYTHTFEYDQSSMNKQALNEFLESVATNIKPITLYKDTFTKETVDSTKFYFSAAVNKDKFKKVTALNIT